MHKDNRISQLERFINNPDMSQAIKETLIESFLKKRTGQDVYLLAASRLAIDYLNEAWRELESYKVKERLSTPTRQVGL